MNTISFTDNQGLTRILNLNRVDQISYDEGRKYFMVYFADDTETLTFKSAEYRDKVIKEITELLQTKAV